MSGAALIAAERQRQMDTEGWTPEHDDGHDYLELPRAAAEYLAHGVRELASIEFDRSGRYVPERGWPWDASWWKPSDDPIRNLVKAGALIAAEIDRLNRANSQGNALEGDA